MRQVLALVMTVGAASALAGCAGDTTAATNVRATQATLNAHGHTNNGPAYWWWEYGVTRKAVQNGQGTKTARQGPASSAADVTLSTVVKGLDRTQAYYFRACGQDQKAGSSVTCGMVRTFTTPPGDSAIAVDTSPGSSREIQYTAGTDVRHTVFVSNGGYSDGHILHVQEVEKLTTTPPTGSDLIPGTECTGGESESLRTYVDTADCGDPGSYPAEIGMTMSKYDDVVDAYDAPGPVIATLGAGHDIFSGGAFYAFAYGGPGNDTIVGSAGANYFTGDDGDDDIEGGTGKDTMYGGTGTNTLDGGAGDDTIHSASPTDTVDCGEGENDFLYVTDYGVAARSAGCENYTVVSAARMKKDEQADNARARIRAKRAAAR